MCLAIPGKVKCLRGQKVLIHYSHADLEALTGGLALKTGDYVLVQMGIVVQKLSATEAASVLALWQQLT